MRVCVLVVAIMPLKLLAPRITPCERGCSTRWMFSGVGGSTAAGVGTWHLHHIRAPQQPVQAHVKAIGNLADAVQIERAQHTNGLKIKSAAAANPNAPIDGIRLHAAHTAGFGETITKYAEICHSERLEVDQHRESLRQQRRFVKLTSLCPAQFKAARNIGDARTLRHAAQNHALQFIL